MKKAVLKDEDPITVDTVKDKYLLGIDCGTYLWSECDRIGKLYATYIPSYSYMKKQQWYLMNTRNFAKDHLCTNNEL